MVGILNVYPRQWLVLLSRSLKHVNLLLVLHEMFIDNKVSDKPYVSFTTLRSLELSKIRIRMA